MITVLLGPTPVKAQDREGADYRYGRCFFVTPAKQVTARLFLYTEFCFPQILACRRTLSIGTAQPMVECLIILDGLRRYAVGKPVARGGAGHTGDRAKLGGHEPSREGAEGLILATALAAPSRISP